MLYEPIAPDHSLGVPLTRLWHRLSHALSLALARYPVLRLVKVALIPDRTYGRRVAPANARRSAAVSVGYPTDRTSFYR
jgi:hypothetical protein